MSLLSANGILNTNFLRISPGGAEPRERGSAMFSSDGIQLVESQIPFSIIIAMTRCKTLFAAGLRDFPASTSQRPAHPRRPYCRPVCAVDPLMPEVDGCLHVMEAGPRRERTKKWSCKKRYRFRFRFGGARRISRVSSAEKSHLAPFPSD
ncbi:hypothetical protein AURDEDRAFT_165290 [Auricularia subglabra TFB-10046 SS5]|nr:hypothetical protein AURDEDRAFT_165290 [Auricularia subglabra TFB-10046 SS5]